MKIAIVGAGIMGLSTAWALARDGHEVALYEQGPIPSPKATSNDAHRLIRYPYGEEAGYARMVADAYAAWEELWVDLGERHYVETGALCLGEAPWTRASERVVRAMGLPIERLSGDEIACRFPMFEASVGEGLYLPSGGVLLADRILADLARHLGPRVALHPESPVREVDLERGRLALAGGDVVGADLVIVAAGAWIGRLVPSLAPRARPSRQVAVYVEPPPALAGAWARSPLIIDIDESRGFYAVPPVAGTGLKLGDHSATLTGDPDDDRVPRRDEIDAVLALCRDRLADFAGYRVARGKVCYYTIQPDERFVIERPGKAGWVMSPCSGHGFKFGPLIGTRLAAAVATGAAGDLTRWARGEA